MFNGKDANVIIFTNIEFIVGTDEGVYFLDTTFGVLSRIYPKHQIHGIAHLGGGEIFFGGAIDKNGTWTDIQYIRSLSSGSKVKKLRDSS